MTRSALLLALLLTVPGPAWAQDPSSAQDGSMDQRASDGPAPDGRVPDATRLPAWAPRLTAQVSPAVAHLGDPVRVVLKVRHRAGVSVNLPLQLELGKFSELSRTQSTRQIPPSEKGGFPEAEQTFVVELAAYDLGRLTLPPVEVTALGPAGELVTLRTEPLTIEIQSLMRNEPSPRAKDLEPPVPVFQRTLWLVYLLAGLALVALTIIVTLIVSRRIKARRDALRPPPPPTPAYVVALERLSQIDVESYIDAEQFKELYLLLSEIMRQYVGRRWGFDAPEMTTAEVAESLQRARVQRETLDEIVHTFEAWDLVKFAKYRPDGDAARQALTVAEKMVRSTSLLAEMPPQPQEQKSHGPA